MLCDYGWPGNVRELDHAIERAVLMAQDMLIHPSDLGLSQNAESGPRFEEMPLEQVEGLLIRRALSHFEGDISRTAEALGLSRPALYRRLEKHQIQ